MKINDIKDLIWNDIGNLTILGGIVSAIVIFILVQILVRVIDRAIDRVIVKREKKKLNYNPRVVTLSKLLSSVSKYSLYILGVLVFLDTIDVNTRAFIATAGIGSLAIAMGAQTLVKDIIQGMFILFEDQYSVGDKIECGGQMGFVEEVGVRVTKLRDPDGSIHIIPNSEIRVVTNMSRGRRRALVVLDLDQTEDPRQVLDVFEKAMEPLRDEDNPGEGPTIWGVTGNLERGYQISIAGYAAPGKEFDLEYEIRQAAVEAMKREGIAQPRWRLEGGAGNGK